jgi:hypothetical protein
MARVCKARRHLQGKSTLVKRVDLLLESPIGWVCFPGLRSSAAANADAWDGEARVGLVTFSSRFFLSRRIDVFSGKEPDAGTPIEAYDSW